MSFSINTNIASLQAQNYLQQSQSFQSKTISQVTSGLRIVSSGDDAAGLAIANGYRSDQAVLTQGVLNANSGLSQLQIIDGGINNISQLLDRARTLATQSASGTFTGDRSVLNNEFQSVVGEINRQAQSIGLDQNGAFAQNLQVFIGGGKANNGISSINNGSVSVDLSKSTVDARSLGLTGVQAIGTAGTDIGSGSAATSLSSILGNANNSSSTATPGFTSFLVRGPGFAANGVQISVNTSNLGGTSDLVTAVNAAIQAAANSGTQSATALKNANITASINTDSNGKQQLAFSSSTSSFQVEAGDRVANALLGNFTQNAVLTGTDTNATVDTSLGGANKQLTLSVDGGSAFTVNVTQGVGTSKGQIVADLNANTTFAAAATASLKGNQIVLTSKTNGSASSVAITTTALSTAVGLTGSSTATDASTGAPLTTTVQGSNAVAAGANVISADTGATAVIDATHSDIKLTVGNSGAQTITLANLGTQTKAEIAADINTQLAANTNFTAANAAQVTASVVNNQIVFTAASPGSSITIGTPTANSLNAELGLTPSTSSVHTLATSDTIHLRFQGSGLTSPVDLALPSTTGGTTTSAQLLSSLQSAISANGALQGAGITLSTSSVGNNLVFTSSKGETFQVLSTGDTQNVLGLGSFLAGTGTSTTDYTSLTAGATYTTGAAGGSGPANLQISLNGLASSSNSIAVNLNGAGTDAVAGEMDGTAAADANGQFDTSAGTGVMNFVIDGTHAVSVTITNAAATGATTIAGQINTALGANGSASVDAGGHIVIKSATTGATSSVQLLATSDAPTLTALGLTASVVHNGTNASEGNVINQINTAISANTSLTNASLQAKDDGTGKIQIVSNNNTFFRLDSSGSGDVGFGQLGQSFAGNAQSAAPTTSQYFDSQGATATNQLAYTDTLYGGDQQTIAITGVDATGAKHSIGINLGNNTTARNQTIDQALATINTKLQQSNDPTLENIVAVKDSTSGVQSIRFLSTLSSFQVSVGSDAGGTGITPPTGNVAQGTTLGTGLTASVDSQTNAEAAVNALANSVALLGSAQAVVGRGENQFTYAVNLAQSQLTNLASAESGIRDANLAADAANLTKAQILVQAGVAALAQANSAPQQLLTLLQGH